MHQLFLQGQMRQPRCPVFIVHTCDRRLLITRITKLSSFYAAGAYKKLRAWVVPSLKLGM